MAWVYAGPAQGGNIVCVAARPSQAWGHAGPAQLPRIPYRSRGPRGLAAPHSIRKRCGPIVWRGSTRVLEETRERV